MGGFLLMEHPKSLLIIGLAAKKPMEDQESVIEFPAPQGFTPPDNAKEGDTFEALATLRMQADGVLQLEAIDGMPVKHDAKAEAQEEEDESPAEKDREAQMGDDESSEGMDQESATSTSPSEEQGEDGDFLKAVMGGLKKKGMGK
jgi:hypothetical protein